MAVGPLEQDELDDIEPVGDENQLYVMELKLDKTAGEAMEQINLKNYPERFSLCGLPVVKVAINFDSERCTIGDWMIEK